MKHLNTGHADLFVSVLVSAGWTMLATISLHGAIPWKKKVTCWDNSHK
jgi:hypothetical protein